MVKSLRIPLFLLIAGLLWAIFSDAAITFYTQSMVIKNEMLFRIVNDLGFFLIITYIVYRLIKIEQNNLISSEKQYRNMFIANPNCMWIFHQHTLQFVAVNNAAVNLYGYSRSEFLNMTIKDIRPPAEAERLMSYVKTSKEGINVAGHWKHLKKSGEEIDVLIISHEIKFNKQPCKMVMATDITDSLKKETLLEEAYNKEKHLNAELAKQIAVIKTTREESNRLEQVINKIQNLVMIVNEDGLITWVNKAFIDFTGYTQNEAVGKRPSQILFGPATDAATVSVMMDKIYKKEFCTFELVNYKKNGDEYWTQLNLSPIFDNAGNFKFFISVENIVTERKEREMELKQQHDILKQIAWSNSHELRRPLCSIISLVDLLKDAHNEQEREEYTRLLELCTIELDEIVKQNNDKINRLDGRAPFLSISGDITIKEILNAN